jgi:galactose oxidase
MSLFFSTSLAIGTLLTPLAAAQRAASAPVPDNGRWEPAFDHDPAGFDPAPAHFNAVHMALVPKGPHQGHVLVWDLQGPQPTPAWEQRWAILDPSEPGAPVFWNGEVALPAGGGDLFCAGHAWNSNGELLVAGGTSHYPDVGHHEEGILGGRLVYLWDPSAGPLGVWLRQPDMEVDRWYPTVVLLDTGEMMIAGGTRSTVVQAYNDYELLAPRPGPPGHARLVHSGRFPGPAAPAAPFGLYPRIFQLATGEQFVSGMGGAAAKMNHAVAPGVWTYTDSSLWLARKYGCAVLAPDRPGSPQRVWTIGGEALDELGGSLGCVDDVESCVPGAIGAPDWDWSALPPMGAARARANAVLLPDGSVFVVGGSSAGSGPNELAVKAPEIFDGRRWHTQLASDSPRTYHSAALLLPSGKVLVGGGDRATRGYQVFVPAYVRSPARPRLSSAPQALSYASINPTPSVIQFAPLPAGESVARVVLMAPGSVTHHFDASQRYLELELESVTGTSVTFRGPSQAARAPRGHYMLFLVTASGVPSVAHWVYVG